MQELRVLAITPFLIAAYNYKKVLGDFIVLLTIIIGCYFGFYALTSEQTLVQQWSTYVNPFNNLFLYTCGIAIYYNFHELDFKKIPLILILSSLCIFIFYPVAGSDQINITTGINRVIFAAAAIILTLGFYKLIINPPSFIAKPLANLGEATYGVYLLHPFVYVFISKVIDNSILTILLTSVITIIAANISYRLYEKPFVKIGKKKTENIGIKQNSPIVN